MQSKATKEYTIDWDGTEEGFIIFADRLHREHFHEGLDSLDMGDATGAFIRVYDFSATNFFDKLTITDNAETGHQVSISADWGPFQHTDDPQPLGHPFCPSTKPRACLTCGKDRSAH